MSSLMAELLHNALASDPRGCEHPPFMRPQCERIAVLLGHTERERALLALADELESYGKSLNPYSDEGWDKAEAMREAGAMLRAALAAPPEAAS
jgi:hypothetical protein